MVENHYVKVLSKEATENPKPSDPLIIWHSYGKWPSPNDVSLEFYVNVYQRVQPFSHGFPMFLPMDFPMNPIPSQQAPRPARPARWIGRPEVDWRHCGPRILGVFFGSVLGHEKVMKKMVGFICFTRYDVVCNMYIYIYVYIYICRWIRLD